MNTLINSLKEQKILDSKVEKYTLLVNEEQEVQGALFFIPHGSREVKVIIQAPHHAKILIDNEAPTYKAVLNCKEALLLK